MLARPAPAATAGADTPPAFERVVEALDECFRDDRWMERRGRIEEAVADLSRDHCMLRYLVEELARQKRWPRIAGAQSFILYLDRNYYIRANLWYPKPNLVSGEEKYRKYLSIGECHNHTYSFFTAAVLGDGYESTFFTADVKGKALEPGDPVDLRERRPVRLAPGDVLFVERDRDFHIQHWPTDFTVTVNVVPIAAGDTSPRQYIVDADRGVVLHAINAGMAH